MSISKRKSFTSEADEIMVKEVAPLITKIFSSITSELIVLPWHWEDEDGTNKKLYDMTSERCIAFIKDYVEGTAKLQYELLCKPPIEKNDF